MTVYNNKPLKNTPEGFITPYTAEANLWTPTETANRPVLFTVPKTNIKVHKHYGRHSIEFIATVSVAMIAALSTVVSAYALDTTGTPESHPPRIQSLTTGEYVMPNIERDNIVVFYVPPTNTNTYTNLEATFLNDTTKSVQYPFKTGVKLSDPFGEREQVCEEDGCKETIWHNGQDFAPGAGAEIQAIADGTVVEVVQWEKNDITDPSHAPGSFVKIQHSIDGQTVVSMYGHLEYMSSGLKVGDTVKVGAFVGRVGNTGQSTAAHLHLGIQVEGKWVDPMVYLSAKNLSSSPYPNQPTS